MRLFRPRVAAAAALAADERRPATAILHDAPDARLLVFRLSPGQTLPPHRNSSTVLLTVVGGRGLLFGGAEEQAVVPGDVVLYDPDELHGIRAIDEELLLLVTITPRPGSR